MNRPEREGSQALRRILEKLEELSTDDYFIEKKITLRSSETEGFEGKVQGKKILGVKSGEIKFREKSGWGNSKGDP